jgi:hypothetical protein
MKGIFREHSGNIQVIFSKHSGNINSGAIREHSRGTFREHNWRCNQGTFKGNIQGT